MAAIEISPASQLLEAAAGYSIRGGSKGDARQAASATASADIIDIPTPAATDASSTTTTAATASSSTGSEASYSTAQMVTFSVTYPGGNVMTTTMSLSDFQAAMKSDDPGALGSETVGTDTWNGKGAILAAMGQSSATGKAGATAQPAHPNSSSPEATAPAGATGADVAISVLQAGIETISDQGGGATADYRTEKPASAKSETVSIASATMSGASNGMTATVSIYSASVTTASNSTSAGSSATHSVNVVI